MIFDNINAQYPILNALIILILNIGK